MTDRQAKEQTVTALKSKRDIVMEVVYDYLWMTLPDGAANYLSATGNLSTTKPRSALICELRNMLAASDIDPGPLIIKRAGKRRAKVSYKGLYLSTHIRNRGYRAIRHR